MAVMGTRGNRAISSRPASGALWGAALGLALLTWLAAAPAAQERTASAADLSARAIALEAEGNAAAALTLFWEAAQAAPRDADVQNRLGEALERIGALEAAIEAFRRAVAVRPGFRKAVKNLVLALVKNGQGAEAVAQARALVGESPDDADALFTLGLAQSEQDVTQAIDTFRRVLAMAPRHALARYNLALVLRRSDRLAEAIAELEQVLAIDPRPQAHYTLGVIYWHQGRLDRAVGALEAAIASEPAYAEAHYALGTVLAERRETPGALEALRRALALRPGLPGVHYTLARVLRASGDEAGARRHLAEGERLRAQAAREQEARVWTAVGMQQFEAGDVLGALDQFRRATTAFPEYAPAHYHAGRALARLGEPEAAQSSFARAHQLNPSLVPPDR